MTTPTYRVAFEAEEWAVDCIVHIAGMPSTLRFWLERDAYHLCSSCCGAQVVPGDETLAEKLEPGRMYCMKCYGPSPYFEEVQSKLHWRRLELEEINRRLEEWLSYHSVNVLTAALVAQTLHERVRELWTAHIEATATRDPEDKAAELEVWAQLAQACERATEAGR